MAIESRFLSPIHTSGGERTIGVGNRGKEHASASRASSQELCTRRLVDRELPVEGTMSAALVTPPTETMKRAAQRRAIPAHLADAVALSGHASRLG
jgi:hypothetical protein